MSMTPFIAKAATLVEALPYIQEFRGALVVVKFGGSAMEDRQVEASTLRDLVLMEAVGMKLVVVHGGGKEISARLKELGVPTRFINGLRYTCDQTIAVVDDVLHRATNARLVAGLREHGGQAETLSGKSILRAQKLEERDAQTGAAVDLGHVGEVIHVDTAPIHAALARHQIPVITPLGVGADGQVYNINADISACQIAAALQARKLVFLSDVPGLLADRENPQSVISTLHASEVEEAIRSGVISGGMVPKIRSAVAALAAGTSKVHLIDGRLQHALLLEIFTDAGVGTQIVPS